MHQITESDDGTTLYASGEFDMHTSPGLINAVAANRSRNPADTLLDLSGVTYLDSAGVAALLRIHAAHGPTLRIRNLSPTAEAVLRISGLREMLVEDPPTL